MTVAEPNGMGLPIPDTGDDNGDAGKIDIYVLGAAQCKERDDVCQGIDELSAVAAAVPTWPFGVSGRPNASSGFLLLSKGRLAKASIVADLAHEFFHVLQFAHNAPEFPHWYLEASATWAEWEYVRSVTTKETFDFFGKEFQENNRSLLAYEDPERVPDAHQYGAWVWPLFQELHGAMGAPSVFTTWQALEPATSREQFDATIDQSLPAKSFFRDFAVTNLQPKSYHATSSSGLEDETWQRLTGRKDFPRDEHLVSRTIGLKQGKSSETTDTYSAKAAALAAQYDQFSVSDRKIHQITIDIGSLQNVGNADLDLVGRLEGGGGKKWVRLTPTTHEVTLCLDDPTENVNLFYVVISNHEVARKGEGADPAQMVKGAYEVTTKRTCDLIPTTFTGTAHAETTTLWKYGDVTVGQEVITVDMSGTFTLNREIWDESGSTLYEFDGEVVYTYEAYEESYCTRVWTVPTSVAAEGFIHLYADVWGVLTYIGDGMVGQIDEDGMLILPEVERLYDCDPEIAPTMTSTGGAPSWFRGQGGKVRITADGLRIKGEWTESPYLGDPDSTTFYVWNFLGECPCPPTDSN
jgi:hypothetical protein